MPSFLVPTPGDLTAQESPPQEFSIQGQKMVMLGGEGGGFWAHLELTDACINSTRRKQKLPFDQQNMESKMS